MKKICFIFSLLIFSVLSVNSFAQVRDGVDFQLAWDDSSAGYPLPYGIQYIKHVVAGVDVDNDTKQEIIVPIISQPDPALEQYTKTISVLEAQGNDQYTCIWEYEFSDLSAKDLATVAVADLDGDGNKEILAIHTPDETVAGADAIDNLYVFEYKGSDNDFGTAPTASWDLNNSTLDNLRMVGAADMDGDGKQEVILTSNTTLPGVVIASVDNFTDQNWTIKYSDETLILQDNLLGVFDVAGLAITDLDGDGTPELALAPKTIIDVEGTETEILRVFLIEWDGSAYQEYVCPDIVDANFVIHALEGADLNEDGRSELLIGSVWPGALYILSTTGALGDIAEENFHKVASTHTWVPGMCMADYDGDDRTDIVISGAHECVYSVEYTAGAGGDVNSVYSYNRYAYKLPDLTGYRKFCVYGIAATNDMDGDGMGEIIFGQGNVPEGSGPYSPSLWIFDYGRIPTGIEIKLQTPFPKDYSLNQNYPNPFNPNTEISYKLPKSGHIKLEIYNILGQKVKTLVNKFQGIGTHNIQWDSSNNGGALVSSGVYFYCLETPDMTMTKKMLLLR